MRKIAITQRSELFESVGETRDTLDTQLVQLVTQCDLCPVPIPNVLSTEKMLEIWLECVKPDAILFSGGQDFGLFPDRDRLEHSLMNFVMAKKIPTLALCRGMQLLIKQAGGSLKKVDGHVDQEHDLKGMHNHRVSSFHNFAPDFIPSEYHVITRAYDECVEAIRHKSLPIEGWMWHPERTTSSRQLHISLIKQLLGEHGY